MMAQNNVCVLENKPNPFFVRENVYWIKLKKQQQSQTKLEKNPRNFDVLILFVLGFSYHIHESWNHNDTYAHVGETDCGSDYTGNHWDPWLSSGTQVDCGSTDYNCNSTLFENDEYSCEIGDLSGKYGNTVLNFAGEGRYI